MFWIRMNSVEQVVLTHWRLIIAQFEVKKMSLWSLPGHGLWMFQYGEKRPVFDVLSPEGTDLSPIMSAIYLFLTMIIVFQVRNSENQRPRQRYQH